MTSCQGGGEVPGESSDIQYVCVKASSGDRERSAGELAIRLFPRGEGYKLLKGSELGGARGGGG